SARTAATARSSPTSSNAMTGATSRLTTSPAAALAAKPFRAAATGASMACGVRPATTATPAPTTAAARPARSRWACSERKLKLCAGDRLVASDREQLSRRQRLGQDLEVVDQRLGKNQPEAAMLRLVRPRIEQRHQLEATEQLAPPLLRRLQLFVRSVTDLV